MYEELTEERKPKFPEAYVHAAQVKIHFGEYEDAIDLLERALGQKFVLTAGVSADIVEGMLDDLRDPALRKQTAAAIDAGARIVAAGGAPSSAVLDSAVGTGASVGGAAAPALRLVEASEAEEADDELSVDDDGPTDEEMGLVCDDYTEDDDEPDTTVDDDDDREPNTDLDDDDYLDDDDDDDSEDEDVLYDLDDDDDREPNTDLDDDDDLYDDSESDEDGNEPEPENVVEAPKTERKKK